MSRSSSRRVAASPALRPRIVAGRSPAVPVAGRRMRTVATSAAAATAALFVIPAAASATVSTTNITSPAPDTVLDSSDLEIFGGGSSGYGTTPITITGTAPGAEDGDEVRIGCTYTANGFVSVIPVVSSPVEVQDGMFTATGLAPTYTCRIRALPEDLYGSTLTPSTDLSPFTGPRVLGGGTGVATFSDTAGGPDPYAPGFEGAEIYQAVRAQSRGLVISTGLPIGTFGLVLPSIGQGGGIFATALIEDTYYRLLFGPSATLGGFGSYVLDPNHAPSVEDAGVVVDGAPGGPIPGVGDKRSKVVSQSTDPATGDLRIVETAPIALITGTGEGQTFTDSGVSIERTSLQDHEGRQITISDVFRSDDGAPHRIEARYGESVFQDAYGDDQEITKEQASFRIPWSTGDDYIVPEEGTDFGPAPAGPATIFVHGPRQDFSSLENPRVRAAAAGDEELRRAEGAYTFDAAPTDGRFLTPGAFVVRFVREIPAGGTTSIKHTYSQDLTPDGLSDLVTDATGGPLPATAPEPPLPSSTPLPTQPAPQPPPPAGLPKLLNPLPLVAKSTRRILFTAAQGRRLRDRKPVTITTRGLPAGRYGITIRRWVIHGRTIASGVRTIKHDGNLAVTLRLTKYGRHYLALKRTRRRASVKVRVIVTWTPPGKARKKVKTAYTTQFR